MFTAHDLSCVPVDNMCVLLAIKNGLDKETLKKVKNEQHWTRYLKWLFSVKKKHWCDALIPLNESRQNIRRGSGHQPLSLFI